MIRSSLGHLKLIIMLINCHHHHFFSLFLLSSPYLQQISVPLLLAHLEKLLLAMGQFLQHEADLVNYCGGKVAQKCEIGNCWH